MLSIRPSCSLQQLFLGLVIALWSGAGNAANAPIEAFFGVFEGETTFLTATGAKKRGISLSIQPFPDTTAGMKGFEVVWTTLTRRSDGTHISKTHHAVFVPADAEQTIFVAVQSDADASDIAKVGEDDDATTPGSTSLSERLPNDPRGTAPYLWGRIKDKTFSVYVVVVTEDGGYEIQVYDRTMTDEGMTLVYSRDRGGEHLKLLEAFLKRKRY